MSRGEKSHYFQEEEDHRLRIDRSRALPLPRAFYDVPCRVLAQNLLGKLVVRQTSANERLSGRIVETEAYLGEKDKAAHSYGGRKTKKNSSMFSRPGTAYVYVIYGIHHCLNVTSAGSGSAVLVRALEPVEGIEEMRQRRETGRRRGSGRKRLLRDWELCNGPGKLCAALGIDKSTADGCDLAGEDEKCSAIENDADDDDHHRHCAGGGDDGIVKCARIGVDYAGEEWASKPLRFYLKASEAVSVRNREAEGKPKRRRLSDEKRETT
ncbi:uncharacterized protein [Oscarella lobularis]|uniref:uncharacterized protein n=1 Tax=Oscarella lobularis TaxID=121494 RepID=UPI003313F87F